jgi:hypothetical protein
MMFLSQRPDASSGRAGKAALLAFSLATMAGCASPGVPRAPSLHLPGRITNLSAERRGDTIVVRFATPLRTTDNEPLTAPVKASLCRAVGDGPCRATASFPGRLTIAGPVEWVDALPPELAAGSPRRLVYRVELFNVQGHSAGPSDPAFVAGGEGPKRVEALRAEGSHSGIVLRWTPEAQASGEVLVEREALNPAPPKKSSKKQTPVAPKASAGPKKHGAAAKPLQQPKDENSVWLHAAEGTPDRDSGGLIDASATVDEPYRYTAVRSRSVTVDGRKFEMRSEPSAAVTLTLRDVYPPAAPQGVLAAGFPVQDADHIAVDLVWQPNVESDLAGYNVYRQALGAGDVAVKLTAKPVALPAFHDVTAVRGVGYRYTVTAVDAKGNESEASVAALLAATP